MQYAALVHKPQHTVARPTAIFWAQLCTTEQEWSVVASSGPEWSTDCVHTAASRVSVLLTTYLKFQVTISYLTFCCLDVSNESTSSRG